MYVLPPALPFFPLLQLHYLTTSSVNRIMDIAGCPINRDEFTLLREIYRENGLSQTSLAQRMGRDRNNLSRTCTDLEKKGLLERTVRPEDRRHYTLSLTAYGKAVFERADKAMEHYRDITRKNYTAEEWQQFKKIIQGFYLNLQEVRDLTDEELVPDASLRTPLDAPSAPHSSRD